MDPLILNRNLENVLSQLSTKVESDIEEFSVDIDRSSNDELDEGLDERDVIIMSSVGISTASMLTASVGANTVLTTGSIVWKTVGLAAVGSFGTVSALGIGMYFGYQYIMKSYREEETLRKVQYSIASKNHINILKNIKNEIARINNIKQQLDSAGEININDIPTRYRENECSICLEHLVSNDSTLQKKLQRLPCGHILHLECYNSLILNGATLCPYDRKELFPKMPKLPIIPVCIPNYKPKSLKEFIKGKVSSAFRTATNITKIAAAIVGNITGAILIALGAGTMVIWIPTLVPTLIFIGILKGEILFFTEMVLQVLGLASVSVIGGLVIYSITANILNEE